MIYATIWSRRLWDRRFAWMAENREPTDSERVLTLRYPISQTSATRNYGRLPQCCSRR